MKTKKRWKFLWHILFLVVVFAFLYPFIFAFSNSFKPEREAYANAVALISETFTFDNYFALNESVPLLRVVFNTFVSASASTFLRVLVSFIAAYALVYYNFKGKNLISLSMMVSMFVPFTVTMIPNYITLAQLNLVDSIIGVIIPQVFAGSAVFLLVQSMRNIPLSLIEAAKVDNTGDLRIMKDIVLPLIRPQLVASSIWFFAGSWNEFVWPSLILKNKENYTLPLALQLFVSNEAGNEFTKIMAMSVVTMIIPLLLYLFFQRLIINTFSSSGIK